jgi:hypothetical protein
MHISPPKDEQELRVVADIYLDYDDGFLPVNREVCHENILLHWKRLGYIRIIHHANRIVGFIAGSPIMTKHSKEKVLLQEYFCTNLTGFAAAKAVKLAHRDMVNYARAQRLFVIMSCGSHMDPDHTFTRILEREGWGRKGHVALLRIVKQPGQAPETPLVERSRSLRGLPRLGVRE